MQADLAAANSARVCTQSKFEAIHQEAAALRNALADKSSEVEQLEMSMVALSKDFESRTLELEVKDRETNDLHEQVRAAGMQHNMTVNSTARTAILCNVSPKLCIH